MGEVKGLGVRRNHTGIININYSSMLSLYLSFTKTVIWKTYGKACYIHWVEML